MLQTNFNNKLYLKHWLGKKKCFNKKDKNCNLLEDKQIKDCNLLLKTQEEQKRQFQQQQIIHHHEQKIQNVVSLSLAMDDRRVYCCSSVGNSKNATATHE